jgi:CheY-like chemotaxis protein
MHALGTVKKKRTRIILLDLIIPVMDGLGFYGRNKCIKTSTSEN